MRRGVRRMMSDVDRYIHWKLEEKPGGFLGAFLHACKLADTETMSILLPALKAFSEKYPLEPRESDDLERKGYEYLNAGVCRGPTCGATLQWWRTPKGKVIPLDPKTREPHWTLCPDHEDFRRG